MRLMARRVISVSARILFFVCGAVSLLTAVFYAFLRGTDLPAQSEWVVFAGALGLVGGFSALIALLPRSWIAKVCSRARDDESLFTVPLKMLGSFAAIFYLLAVGAYYTPHTWNLDPLLMLSICPMYVVRMTFDPAPAWIFLILAPMNAAVFGALGVAVGYALLAFRRRR
jgi:hypothetical protein